MRGMLDFEKINSMRYVRDSIIIIGEGETRS